MSGRKFIWRVKLTEKPPAPASARDKYDWFYDVVAPNAEAAAARGRMLMRREPHRRHRTRGHVVSVKLRGELDA